MPTVTFSGKVKQINPTQIVGEKGFKKREFLLSEIKDQYPSTWQLECQKDMCEKLDTVNVGDEVTCMVEITGREWKDKAFNTLKAFRIDVTSKGAVPLVSGSDDVDDQMPF